jgi:hypothetical protein
MARQLDATIDAHVTGAIEAAGTPNGSTGADLVAKIRNGIADMRDLGGEPTHIALSPSNAAGLDLIQDSAGNYVFALRLAGSGSPVWSLQVREAAVSDPLLVDPRAVGLDYSGEGSVLVDPYSSMERNLVRAR